MVKQTKSKYKSAELNRTGTGGKVGKYNFRSSDLNLRAVSDAYNDGFEDGKADVDTQAYFMGVGYGKSRNKVENIGFKTKEHKDSFVQGTKAHDKHFLSFSTKDKSLRSLSLLERFMRLFKGKKKRVKSVTLPPDRRKRQRKNKKRK